MEERKGTVRQETSASVLALPPAQHTTTRELFPSAGQQWLYWLVSKGFSSINVTGYDDIQEYLKYLLFNNGHFIGKQHC